jgi:mono/diheme cytochrome c family protein
MCCVALAATGQDAASFFGANCASCHTIGGGRLTGPDLKDVTERKDRDWLRDFIVNPAAKINAGDPYALQLLEESRGVIMPPAPGMTPALAGELLDLIESESALEESRFRGAAVSLAPFTPADAARGRALFTGRERLAAGGASCMSCHSVPGAGVLGGGHMGPDLTLVYERLQGRAGLGAWLSAPATPIMGAQAKNAPLTQDEVHALTAFFEEMAKEGRPVAVAASQLSFSLIGLGGAVLLLFVLDALWNKRFRAVRRPLVEAARKRGDA